MNIFDEGSLYQTVTNAAMHLFDGRSFNASEKTLLVTWILGHQNRYKGFTFYPMAEDREHGIRLFSGEKPRAKFLADNVVELETLRILALIQPEAPEVRGVLQEANKRLFPLCFANGCAKGECAHASIAFLRYLTAYDFEASSGKIGQAREILRQRHNGNGAWGGFPFYFTLLWLTELPGDVAHDELCYARDHCEKLSRRLKGDDPVELIRRKILQSALDR